MKALSLLLLLMSPLSVMAAPPCGTAQHAEYLVSQKFNFYQGDEYAQNISRESNRLTTEVEEVVYNLAEISSHSRRVKNNYQVVYHLVSAFDLPRPECRVVLVERLR